MRKGPYSISHTCNHLQLVFTKYWQGGWACTLCVCMCVCVCACVCVWMCKPKGRALLPRHSPVAPSLPVLPSEEMGAWGGASVCG